MSIDIEKLKLESWQKAILQIHKAYQDGLNNHFVMVMTKAKKLIDERGVKVE